MAPLSPDAEAATRESWYLAMEFLATYDDNPDFFPILEAVIKNIPNFWTGIPFTLWEKIALRYLDERSGSGRANAPPSSTSAPSATNLAAGLVSPQNDRDVLLSHDPHQFILQPSLCMKCCKGGQLSTCSARDCPVLVHKSCLEPPDGFEAVNVFYCPFCSYARASRAFCTAEKQLYQARNALSAFISSDSVKGHPKKLPPACVEENEHLAQPDTTDYGNNEGVTVNHIGDASRVQEKDYLNSVNDTLRKEKLDNQAQIRAAPDYDTRRVALMPHHVKKKYDKLHLVRGTVENTDGTKGAKSSSISCNKHIILENQEKLRAAPDHVNEQEALNSQPSDRPAKRKRDDAAIDKTNENQENFANSRRGILSSGNRKKRVPQPKRYVNQQVKLGRRRKLYWTSEEEEALKDAIQRFVVDADGNYPWTKILEFGHHVFDKTREPGDLKDKWRNIRKKEVKQEM